MADTVLTLVQIENLFQSMTSQILGTADPSVVRIGWPKDGEPAWQITQDICFLLIRYQNNSYTQQMVTEYSPADSTDANVNTSYTLGISVTWNLYGPNSFDHADLIRSNLFQDTYTQTLASNNLALVTDVAVPVRIPELYNGQWWERSSFSAEFNELVVRRSTVPYLQTADVQLIEG